MSARNAIRSNKTAIHEILSGDHRLILNKVYENKLITQREYNNLKSINSANAETHVIELVDKIMNKGEDKCKDFLNLLQTDGAIKETFPLLASLQLSCTPLLSEPVQVSSCQHDVLPQDGNMSQDVYQIISRPVGLCVIINNNNFKDGSQRRGTDKDAQSLAEVFRCLGFRVLMCEDLNKDQMDQALTFVASLADMSQLQKFNFKEWDGSSFVDPQQVLEHGDAFICSILSHGKKGVVLGTDRNPLPIKEITRKFRGCDQSVLTGKPKVFLIQACQGSNIQRGVQMNDMEIDDDTSPLTIPEEADVLVAMATVEDHASLRHIVDGSWFVQSLCEQLKEHCPRGKDIVSILHYVNDGVAHRETSSLAKQMPEMRFTLRKKLVLPPQCT
ncbi:caspase-8-like isoform X1 [Haplochromis burtoni]|uniref:caspase-8-like isoform X1 n=1 Tax=Haplochromis burtoni TaxID=8153 RepID=UPI001C2D00F3|nr:caspase-8-like isoform X1 [Haplochromis burtoni]